MTTMDIASKHGAQQVAKGLATVKAKGQWWLANHEVHSAKMTGPSPHGERFVVGFQYNVTNKPSGKRLKLTRSASTRSATARSRVRSFSKMPECSRQFFRKAEVEIWQKAACGMWFRCQGTP
jgi:hypothetical protein